VDADAAHATLSPDAQDARDADALLAVLETEVLPCWIGERERWTTMMEQSIEMARRRFSADRMLESYYRLLYDPCLRRRGSEEGRWTDVAANDARD
jgi:hypothetical protein